MKLTRLPSRKAELDRKAELVQTLVQVLILCLQKKLFWDESKYTIIYSKTKTENKSNAYVHRNIHKYIFKPKEGIINMYINIKQTFREKIIFGTLISLLESPIYRECVHRNKIFCFACITTYNGPNEYIIIIHGIDIRST